MDCSLPGSSVHRILQAWILKWVAISFLRGSSQPRDWTWVSCIAGRFFTVWATREIRVSWRAETKPNQKEGPRQASWSVLRKCLHFSVQLDLLGGNLEKEIATHSSILARRIPGTEDPNGLPSVGLQSQTRLTRLSSSSSRWKLKNISPFFLHKFNFCGTENFF